MMLSSVCKICTTIPSVRTPGAGLICVRPSHGSPWPTTILTPDSEKCLSEHYDPAITVMQPKRPLITSVARSFVRKRLQQLKQNLWLVCASLRMRPAQRQRLVICYGLMNLPAAFVCAKIHSSFLVISLHNVTEMHYISRSKLLRWLVGQCDEIWTVSEELTHQVADLFGCPIFYRPTGFDPDGFRNEQKADRFDKRTIVSVGSFKWKKAYPDLLRALSMLKGRGERYHLKLIGDGELRQALEEEACNLGIHDQVEFLGIVSQSIVAQEFNNASLFVLPSVAEGRPKVVLEALATGLPCVVTDACNYADVIVGCGIEVPASSPPALAEAIGHFLKAKDQWAAASSQAGQNISHFRWKEIAENEHSRIARLMGSMSKI